MEKKLNQAMSKRSQDKAKRSFSMKELMKQHQAQDGVTEAPSRGSNGQIPVTYDEEFDNKINQYNELIYNINPKYSELKPRFDVLVRVFLKPVYKDESGLMMPHTLPVRIPTNASVPGASIGFVENPFPYSQKAIIVSIPEEVKDLKQGDIVFLSKTQVVAHVEGKSENALIDIPNKFVHPDEVSQYFSGVPYDPSDDNYGYLLIPSYDIKIKI